MHSLKKLMARFTQKDQRDGTWWRPEALEALRVLLPVKVALITCISITVQLFPEFFNTSQWRAIVIGNTGALPTSAPDVSTMLMAWDSQHYLSIAASGYPAAGPELAFYPLWPGLIHAFSPLFGGKLLLTSLVLSNLISLLAGLCLFDLMLRRSGSKAAWATLVLSLAFPWSFFLAIPYSESLFLFLSVALFWGMERKAFFLVFCAALLLPLSRPIGIFAVAPLLWWSALQWRESHERKSLLMPFVPILGFGVYLLIMQMQQGNAFVGFGAQDNFIAKAKLVSLFDFKGFFEAFLNVEAEHSFVRSPLDRAIFLLSVLGLGVMLRRILRGDHSWVPLFLWAAPCIIIPAMTVKFMSFGRFAMVVFPLWMLLGEVMQSRPKRLVALLIVGIPGQAVFVWWHLNFTWVA